MPSLRRVLDALTGSFHVLGMVALATMMLHITLDVACRTLISAPLPGTLSIVSHYYMVPVVYLPLAMVERLDAHITVDILYQHLRPAIQRWQNVLVQLLATAYFGALTWLSAEDAWESMLEGDTEMGQLSLLIWPARFILPVGMGVLTMLLVYKATCLAIGRGPAFAGVRAPLGAGDTDIERP